MEEEKTEFKVNNMDNEKVFSSDITREQKPLQNNLYDLVKALDNEDNEKVFSSDIIRGQKPLQNNLYDLVKVIAAIPTVSKPEKDYPCDFVPNTGKTYIPKKRTRYAKVKTVRDIRKTFEADVLTDLSQDLDKQQNILFKTITAAGSLRQDSTKTFAKNILKCDEPVSRTSWQMLMTLNPEGQAHAIQYVLWNGRRIRVNGSRGGKNNFLCNFDLAKRREKKKEMKKNYMNKKPGLIQNSLAIKFKPGPLSKKKYLDNSFQKYNLGDTELVNLPKVGLDIRPTYGVTLEPSIANFLQNLRDVNGTIQEKWAEFSVTVLGTLKNSGPTQASEGSGVTFDLKYKSNQHRMLMRQDFDKEYWPTNDTVDLNGDNPSTEFGMNVDSEVKNIVDQIIDAVEISVRQDNMFSGIETPRKNSVQEDGVSISTTKTKKRLSELDRLDVTVIRLPDAPEDTAEICTKANCSLGCVCASLKCDYSLKQHCGRLECMFECKCDFSKYRAVDSFDSDCPDLIPGLINLDNELNMKLAKEEQKFHQTVVMAGEKSILLKPDRRNWKTSKRYSDFYSSMCLKNDVKTRQTLSIVDVKLNLKNVEPWCMVHNLYKCFCKGRFTHDIRSDATFVKDESALLEYDDSNTQIISSHDSKNSSKSRPERIVRKQTISELSEIIPEEFYSDDCSTCSRVNAYKGRKYSNSYYIQTNKKILEMEQNDSNLRKKMMSIINKSDNNVYNDLDNNQQREKVSKQIMTKEVMKITDDDDASCSSENSMRSNKRLANAMPKNISSKTLEVKPIPKKAKLETMEISQGENMHKNYPSKYSINSTRRSPRIFAAAQTPLEDQSVDSSEISPIKDIKNDSIKKSEPSTSSALKNETTPPKAAVNSILNKAKLIAWLETAYKQYKQRLLQNGVPKKSLEAPKHGKVALYPWEFILSRYRERKNLFMVSKQKPFRIFMAIDIKHSFFDNCINIDDIRFADLNQYPATIKNLLTNATDLKENFFILSGLSLCWEVIGSVTKIKDKFQTTNSTDSIDHDKMSERQEEDEDSHLGLSSDNDNEHPPVLAQDVLEENITESKSNTESKWFVMTVENDFSEIQFFNRGFFVKYESIIKAINVARMSGKTVRLSSQKCGESSYGPQFGIYAIPNANEYYVFVGPYDKDEPLGIETVKSLTDITKPATTRGVWITTKKVDNVKVIDNPLSFMPPKDQLPSNIISLESESVTSVKTKDSVPVMDSATITNPQELCSSSSKKTIKPIKIKLTNGFYHLAPGKTSLLKKNYQVSLFNTGKVPAPAPAVKKPMLEILPLTRSTVTSDISLSQNKPVAEIAPQIKIVDVFSEADTSQKTKIENNKPEGGMFILKPEEINKRLIGNQFIPITALSQHDENLSNIKSDDVIEQDIEAFISNSVELDKVLNSDAFIISDEEDNEDISQNRWRDVWIECENNEYLGWIKGRKNAQNQISFEFPGFLFSDFYDSEEEVFSKINQVLSRKIYVPRNMKLKWRVVDRTDELHVKHKLKAEELGVDFVLTKRGLRHKRDLIASSSNLKPSTQQIRKLLTSEVDMRCKVKQSRSCLEISLSKHLEIVSKLLLLRHYADCATWAIDAVSDLEEKSKSLDDHTDELMSKLKLLKPVPKASPNQEGLSKTLESLLTDNLNNTG